MIRLLLNEALSIIYFLFVLRATLGALSDTLGGFGFLGAFSATLGGFLGSLSATLGGFLGALSATLGGFLGALSDTLDGLDGFLGALSDTLGGFDGFLGALRPPRDLTSLSPIISLIILL